MDRLFRIDFYPHDWLVHTGHMNLQQRGLFIQICALIYANRGAIENDPAWIGRASGCSARLARTLIEELVALNSLQVQGSKITQKRCENELKTKRTHLENSAKGGRIRHENEREVKENNNLNSSEGGQVTNCPDSVPIPTPSPIDNKEAKASLLENTENPKPENQKPEGKDHDRKRKPKPTVTQLPNDWKPHDGHVAKCTSLGFAYDELADEFRNYHLAKGTAFANWDAAFFTWIGNAKKFSKGNSGRGSFGRQQPASVVDAALRAAAKAEKNSQ